MGEQRVKYETMTSEKMHRFVRRMDETLPRLVAERERIVQEIKGMQDRKEILSWDEIASALVYPKAMPDKERICGGNSNNDKLLGQLDQINRIYLSQMEELCEELASVEIRIGQNRFVNRCIGRLEASDKEIIEGFTRKDLTYETASQLLHMTRNTLYKLRKEL